MGQTLAHRPHSRQDSAFRLIRVNPRLAKGLSTAAIGQNQRQKGIARISENARIAPATTYAHTRMSAPWRLRSA